MVELLPFLLRFKYIIIFYLIIIALLLIHRRRISVYAKFIILYRAKWGLQLMDWAAKKWREWIIIFGYIGVGAGFIGLVIISAVLLKNLYSLATQPDAVSGVSLVLPGIEVPGLGILPFWYWILAIFLIAVVHEFSHGIVARAHNIEVKNSGLVFLGPILGAFVEPNEKKLRREADIKQYSVLAAGSFSNVILAIVALLLLNFAFSPLQQSMVEPTGFAFDAYYGEDYPFELAGIPPGSLITGLNNLTTVNFQEFNAELGYHRPGGNITVVTPNGTYQVMLAVSPDVPTRGFLGISQIRNEFEVEAPYSAGWRKAWYHAVDWFSGFLRWLFLLSLGIGLFNLLPLPIVDGGRMAQVFLHKLKGPLVGEKRYRQVALFFLLILLLNLFYPLLSRIF